MFLLAGGSPEFGQGAEGFPLLAVGLVEGLTRLRRGQPEELPIDPPVRAEAVVFGLYCAVALAQYMLDGRAILRAQYDHRGSELMLVENFQ